MRALVVAVAGLSLAGCAAMSKITGGATPSTPVGPVGGGLIPGGLDPVEIKNKVDECNSFSDKQVAYSEETSIGGAVALGLAKNTKSGVYVEVAPELEKLKSVDPGQYGGKKPTPGKGTKTDLNKYVNEVGKGLAAFSDRPAIDWTFAVLDSDTPNAFSAPGGYVFITTGMLKTLENEAQLAGVLGHEIGHVTGRHAIVSYQEGKKIACYSAFFADKLSGPAAAGVRSALGPIADRLEQLPFANEVLNNLTGGFNPNGLGAQFIRWLTDQAVNGISKGFDKGKEFDADATATRLMIFAGYDSEEFEKVLGKLPDGGGFFTPHPSNQARIEVVQKTRAEYEGFAGVSKAPKLSPIVKKAVQ